jgi:general L-amino acid transport system permease protein
MPSLVCPKGASVTAPVPTEALAEPVAPAPEPPSRDLTPRQWVRANLASSPLNIALTLVTLAIGGWVVYRLARWVFVTSDWAIVRANLRLFMIGLYPKDQLWRLWVALYVLAATLGLAAGALGAAARRPEAAAETETGDGAAPSEPADRVSWMRRVGAVAYRYWPLLLAVVVVLSFTRTPLPSILTVGMIALLTVAAVAGRRLPARVRRWVWLVAVLGAFTALQVVTAGPNGVGWDDWGGLQLALAATVAGIALAFPLGLVLAIARRSSLPGIRVVAVGYIEGVRAVPLVTLLFVGQYMIGFLFPTTVSPPSFLVRAIIAITLFEAAYIAEIVRGGLAAVPSGQVEAAQALGLRPLQVLRLVVLPQALRAVIPAMVGQFISLFKDTSLLAIVGFIELLGVARRAATQPGFQGPQFQIMTLVFVGFLFWAACSTMSRESRRLERRLGVGER